MPESIRRRRRLHPSETDFLIRVFEQYPRPTAPMREMLAQKLSMSPRGIQIWFQNRRAKVKRDLIESGKAMLLFAPTYDPAASPSPVLSGGMHGHASDDTISVDNSPNMDKPEDLLDMTRDSFVLPTEEQLDELLKSVADLPPSEYGFLTLL